MSDLWADSRAAVQRSVAPLAVRMRPRSLEQFAGQQHILGPGKLLRRMLEADALTSIILHGPPGTGKTTLAEVIASHTRRHFIRENAASVGVKRIREIIDEAQRLLEATRRRSVLFLDEIHRFTRAQQDVLLADVERGIITLIGATTENPLFAVNSALVSRSTLFRLEPLSIEDTVGLLKRAIADPERGYGRIPLSVADEALHVWGVKSDGDARRALTALEVAVLSQQGVQARRTRENPSQPIITGGEAGVQSDQLDRVSDGRAAGLPLVQGPDGRRPLAEPEGPQEAEVNRARIVITRADAEDSIQQKAAVYDQTGDEHYDSISAMIKSIRGSDPDAAVYWIARMLEGGEDPRFIARRLAILASEDVGNADPRGIMVAAACWELIERIGMPEARITLSHCATYLALAPKSNAAYVAIDEAMRDVREGRTLPVPVYLRDTNSSPLAEGIRTKEAGVERYQYSHDVPGAITGQDYLGVERQYYRPGSAGAEKQMGERLEAMRKLRAARPRGEEA